MKKPTTLKDIAEICGVSRQAVSAALGLSKSNNTRISEEKAQKILAVVKKYNFRPNRSAQKLQSKKHDAYGLLVSNVCNIAITTLAVMVDAIRERGNMLIVDSFVEDNPSSRFLREDCVDGIITFDDLPDTMVEGLEKAGLPWVSVNTNRRTEVNAVTYGEEGGVMKGAYYLKAQGCETLALVIKQFPHYSCQARHDGYQAVVDAGLTQPYVLSYENVLSQAEVDAFLKKNPDVDGFILGGTEDAYVIYEGLRARGKSPGKDAFVIGFQWPAHNIKVSPRIAALSINQNDLCHSLVSRLDDLIVGKQVPSEGICLDYYTDLGR